MLNRLMDGFEGKLTPSKWAKLTECSQDTAYRDIVDRIDAARSRKAPQGAAARATR